jgi:hypothetical protein
MFGRESLVRSTSDLAAYPSLPSGFLATRFVRRGGKKV